MVTLINEGMSEISMSTMESYRLDEMIVLNRINQVDNILTKLQRTKHRSFAYRLNDYLIALHDHYRELRTLLMIG